MNVRLLIKDFVASFKLTQTKEVTKPKKNSFGEAFLLKHKSLCYLI